MKELAPDLMNRHLCRECKQLQVHSLKLHKNAGAHGLLQGLMIQKGLMVQTGKGAMTDADGKLIEM